eukprot:m.339269 g.339269  ORF g.339269 m.339269 type:complete len:89 (-) comp18729_c0_seq1:7-273(-)
MATAPLLELCLIIALESKYLFCCLYNFANTLFRALSFFFVLTSAKRNSLRLLYDSFRHSNLLWMCGLVVEAVVRDTQSFHAHYKLVWW